MEFSEKQIEHKTPVARSGGNGNENLCLSCRDCNTNKGDMTYDEYMKYLELTSKDSPFNFSKSLNTALRILSEYSLTETVRKETTELTHEAFDSPVIKNILIKNEKGEDTGLIKKSYTVGQIKVTTIRVEEKLTKYGEIYNTICRIHKKKILKPVKSTTVIKKIVKYLD